MRDLRHPFGDLDGILALQRVEDQLHQGRRRGAAALAAVAVPADELLHGGAGFG